MPGHVAVVVDEIALGHLGAAGARPDDLDLGAVDLVVGEGEGEPGEIAAAARAADDHVGQILARLLELLLGLEADDGLVEHHVVEHAAECVAGPARWDR
jgi:hypothetical protein